MHFNKPNMALVNIKKREIRKTYCHNYYSVDSHPPPALVQPAALLSGEKRANYVFSLKHEQYLPIGKQKKKPKNNSHEQETQLFELS